MSSKNAGLESGPAAAPQATEQQSVSAPQGESFAQRKANQLRQEREASGEVRPVTPSDPEGTPDADVGFEAEDMQQDAQGLYADDNDELEQADSSEDPDGTPSGEDLDQVGESIDWEQRYTDLQSTTQTDRESQQGMEQEHAESMAQHLQLRFEMEDRLSEAVQRAEYMRNVMSGNAQQYKNINWAQVPPERVAEVQAQAQQALQMEQQADNAWSQMKGQVDEVREKQKTREAAIARTRLNRTIPDWSNETYGALRDFAAKTGMPAEEFNEITSPVMIEAMHAYKTLREGATTVQNVKTNRKPTAPRGSKAARRNPRDARGKFAKTSLEPNQKGSFANKHQHRLAMERQGR